MDAPVIRVVVVDDHALHRDGTRQILEAYPDLHVVGDANSGEAALEVINRLRPDVVLMDIRLTGNKRHRGHPTTHPGPSRHPRVDGERVRRRRVRPRCPGGRGCGIPEQDRPGKELIQAVRIVARGTSVFRSGLTARLVMSSR
jgi:two-component system response regulator DevR